MCIRDRAVTEGVHAALRRTQGTRARRLAGRYNPPDAVILGVEVREDAVLAVVAEENGAITRRGRHDGVNGSSAAGAIRAALADASPSSVGVAIRDPLEQSTTDVVTAIAAAAGQSSSPRIVTRGSAVALGESWRGAAKDARQVIALTAADTCLLYTSPSPRDS